MAGLPPFMYQALLSAESKVEGEAMDFLQRARCFALELKRQVEVYGAIPAAMPKRANHYRAQVLVQGESRKRLQEFLREWKPQLDLMVTKRIRWSLEVDPIEF